MALTSDDLQQLAGFVRGEVATAITAVRNEIERDRPAEPTPEQAAQARAAVVGIPDVPADGGPEYWVHLANGDVITSHDSGSTHVDVDGVAVPVIGRYQKPEGNEAS